MIQDIKQKVIEKVYALGFDSLYFVRPEICVNKAENSRRIEHDPYHIMPQATCLVVLLAGYSPYLAREDDGPNLSAYYTASNRAYRAACVLEKWASTQDFTLIRAGITQKAEMELTGVAHIGKNSLAYVEGLGSRFAVQTMLTGDFAPDDAVMAHSNPHSLFVFPLQEHDCKGCNVCSNACPMGAIGADGLVVSQCLREHMSGVPGDEAKEKIGCLLGCEICQSVCPKNANCNSVEMPQQLRELFHFENILRWYKSDMQAFGEVVGKNYAQRKLLRAQAIYLAAKAQMWQYADWVRTSERSAIENEKQASLWYLERLKEKTKS